MKKYGFLVLVLAAGCGGDAFMGDGFAPDAGGTSDAPTSPPTDAGPKGEAMADAWAEPVADAFTDPVEKSDTPPDAGTGLDAPADIRDVQPPDARVDDAPADQLNPPGSDGGPPDRTDQQDGVVFDVPAVDQDAPPSSDARPPDADGGSCAPRAGLYALVSAAVSMTKQDVGQSATRWANATDGVSGFVHAPASQGLSFGMAWFPVPSDAMATGSCQAGDYGPPVVPIDTLPGNADTVAALMGAHSPFGVNTLPLALAGALAHAKQWRQAHPGLAFDVALIIDSQSLGCGGSLQAASTTAQNYANGNPSVRTYVIGLGPDIGNLSGLAQGGGTDQVRLANDAASLRAVLDAIRCEP